MLAVLMAYFLSIGSYVFASFPVKTMDSNNKITIKTPTHKSSAMDTPYMFKSEKKLNKITTPAAPVTGDDDLVITLLLWLFLGWIAGHRWYKHKPAGWNILFILTLGGCGIWALVDLINILTGNF